MKDPKIIALRVRIGKEITGNPDFKNEDFVGIDAKDKIAITNAMKREIAANPNDYAPTQVKIANTPEIENIEEFTFSDVVESAVEGAGEGAIGFGKNLGSGLKLALTLASLASGAFAVVKLSELLKTGKK